MLGMCRGRGVLVRDRRTPTPDLVVAVVCLSYVCLSLSICISFCFSLSAAAAAPLSPVLADFALVHLYFQQNHAPYGMQPAQSLHPPNHTRSRLPLRKHPRNRDEEGLQGAHDIPKIQLSRVHA